MKSAHAAAKVSEFETSFSYIGVSFLNLITLPRARQYKRFRYLIELSEHRVFFGGGLIYAINLL